MGIGGPSNEGEERQNETEGETAKKKIAPR